MVKISGLKEGMKNVNIEVTIDFVGEKRMSAGYGAESYCPAFVKDETGEIRMTIFGPDVNKVKKRGTKIKIKKGYVTEYKGELQLNTKRESPIEIIK